MGGDKAIGVATFLALIILVLAYYMSPNSIFTSKNEHQSRLSNILDAMLEIERVHNVDKVRIAVGYGSCHDLFIKGSELLGSELPPQKPHHYGHIASMEQLKETYAMFFSVGSAAERFVSNETLFRELVTRAEKVSSSYYLLGGNAPTMAKRFAIEGASVMLAAKSDKYVMDDILPNIVIAGGASTGSRSDVHLIFEYFKGEKWGKYSSPRANRFIIHKDLSNPIVSSASEFGRQLQTFRPHLLVIGGLQMMDSFPYKTGEREKYLSEIHLQISLQPKTTLVHFEMASFTDENLFRGLKKLVIPFADSIGMNEQELPNLHSLLKFNNVSVVSEQNPRVAQVLDQMRDLFRILGKSSGNERPLTRLHVHTLAFQAIMVDVKGPWKNTRAAATKAALVAHRHVCHKKEVEVTHSDILMDESFGLSTHPNTGRVMFDDLNPVSCWLEETRYQICIAPVLICTKVQQTAGGGDNISAAGLILQV